MEQQPWQDITRDLLHMAKRTQTFLNVWTITASSISRLFVQKSHGGPVLSKRKMRGEDTILPSDAEWLIWLSWWMWLKKLKSWTSSCRIETKKCVKWSVLWRHSQQMQQPLFCGLCFEELMSCLYSSCLACVVLPQLLLVRVSCYFTCIICLFVLACLVICSTRHREC